MSIPDETLDQRAEAHLKRNEHTHGFAYPKCPQCLDERMHKVCDALLRDLLAALVALRAERDDAITEHGMESGFWGRVAARATQARKAKEAECARLTAALEQAQGLIASHEAELEDLQAAYQHALRGRPVPCPKCGGLPAGECSSAADFCDGNCEAPSRAGASQEKS
jgi:hypothetical protein